LPGIKFIAKLFIEKDDWRAHLQTSKFSRYLSFLDFFNLSYLLGYKREEICIKNTNKFWWKLAKKLVDDEFVYKMIDYKIQGPEKC